MAAYPAFQIEDGPSPLRQSVVVPPAPDIPLPLVPQLFARETLAGLPELAHSYSKALQPIRGHFDLTLAGDPKPQKASLPSPPDAAFAGVDLQTQMLLDPLRQGSDQPIGTRLTADVDVTVVRVTAEAVPTLLQFLIQWIQVDVGQQRRKGSPLRSPLLPAG